jgi:hypothetical protein
VQASATVHYRWRLILLFLAVAGIVSLFNFPYSSSFYLSLFLLRFSIFSFLPLVALDWLYASSGRIPTRRLLSLFFAGIAATVGSASYSTILVAAGPCTPGVSGAGFPLPWFLNFYAAYLGALCPFPGPDTNVGTFPLFAFLFDVIFYLAFAIAGNELFRRAKRKRLQPGNNLPESPKEVALKTPDRPS